MSESRELSDTTLGRMFASYNNPRLLNQEITFLDENHKNELREMSAITVWDEYADEKLVPGVGTLRRIGFHTEQGYTYDALVGIPERPECEVPVIGTTAWTTSLRGHNEHVVRNLVRNGNYVIFVGAEGSYLSKEPPVPQSPISLANSAAAVLNFSYHMVEELRKNNHKIDPKLRVCVGESRAGMVAEGIDALAEEFAQEVVFVDETAPCLPKKLVSFFDLIRLGEQVVKEPREMYKLLGSLTLSRLQYYPRTIDIRKECLRNQLIIGGALFSGETGALARKNPGTSLKHITVFNNDFASMRSEWEAIYGNNPRVRITPLAGGHMTIADLETLDYVLARNKVVQDFINDNKPLTDKVFDLSHERAKQQIPIRAEHMNALAVGV